MKGYIKMSNNMKTVIGDDVEISGNIKCDSNIEINGKLNGDLTCNGQANIGSASTIKGNIQTSSVMLDGQLNGNITAKDKIELHSSARLHGDIRAKRLTVEDGVTFVGKVEVNPSPGNKAQEKKPEQDMPESDQDAQQGKGLFRR